MCRASVECARLLAMQCTYMNEVYIVSITACPHPALIDIKSTKVPTQPNPMSRSTPSLESTPWRLSNVVPALLPHESSSTTTATMTQMSSTLPPFQSSFGKLRFTSLANGPSRRSFKLAILASPVIATARSACIVRS